MVAPIVVAKGIDHMAQKIKARGAITALPTVENVPPHTGALQGVEVGRPFPDRSWRGRRGACIPRATEADRALGPANSERREKLVALSGAQFWHRSPPRRSCC